METKTRYYIVRLNHTDTLYRLKEDTGELHWCLPGEWFESSFSTDDLLSQTQCKEISEDEAKLWLFERGY